MEIQNNIKMKYKLNIEDWGHNAYKTLSKRNKNSKNIINQYINDMIVLVISSDLIYRYLEGVGVGVGLLGCVQ
mgnify:CR=1 FL=1